MCTAPRVRSVSIQRLSSTSVGVAIDLHYTGGGNITSITLTHGNLSLSLEPPEELDFKRWGGVVYDSQLLLLVYSTDVVFSVTLSNEAGHQMAGITAQQSFSEFIVELVTMLGLCITIWRLPGCGIT